MSHPSLPTVRPKAPEGAPASESTTSRLRIVFKEDGVMAGPHVEHYMDGVRSFRLYDVEGYEEAVVIPKGEPSVVDEAIGTAVREGKLWLTSGPASVLAEIVPAGIITDDAILQAPPQPIPATDVLPMALSEAWSDAITTAQAIGEALSAKAGKILPWVTVREAIDGACRARMLERPIDSGPWPCDYGGAHAVKLKVPTGPQPQPLPPPRVTPPGVLIAEAELRPNELQDLADQIGDITKAAVGHELKFMLRIELGGKTRPPEETIKAINEKLQEVSEDLELK